MDVSDLIDDEDMKSENKFFHELKVKEEFSAASHANDNDDNVSDDAKTVELRKQL